MCTPATDLPQVLPDPVSQRHYFCTHWHSTHHTALNFLYTRPNPINLVHLDWCNNHAQDIQWLFLLLGLSQDKYVRVTYQFMYECLPLCSSTAPVANATVLKCQSVSFSSPLSHTSSFLLLLSTTPPPLSFFKIQQRLLRVSSTKDNTLASGDGSSLKQISRLNVDSLVDNNRSA